MPQSYLRGTFRRTVEYVVRLMFLFNLATLALAGLLVANYVRPDLVTVDREFAAFWFALLALVTELRLWGKRVGEYPSDYWFHWMVQGELYVIIFVGIAVTEWLHSSFDWVTLSQEQESARMLATSLAIGVASYYVRSFVGVRRIKDRPESVWQASEDLDKTLLWLENFMRSTPPF